MISCSLWMLPSIFQAHNYPRLGYKTECSLFVCLLQVNNVGTNVRKPTLEYTGEDFSFVIASNLESAYHCSQLGHPLLKASGNGNIVFISSVAGVVAINTGILYAATKGT